MDDLESRFEQRLRESIRESRALGFQCTRIEPMINKHGGKQTAILLVNSGEIHEGLRRTVQMGRHDLSVESIMLEPEFAPPFFTEKQLDAARWRLKQAQGNNT
jgi:hypothetical protein